MNIYISNIVIIHNLSDRRNVSITPTPLVWGFDYVELIYYYCFMKEYEKEGFEKDNPFFYVQYGDRRTLLRILFPTIDNDLLFNVEMDNESLLDDFNIPHKVYGLMPYIITHDDELRDYLYEKCYEYRKIKYHKHYIVTSDHAYSLVNWEEIEEWHKLPFYKKWFIKKPIKELKSLNQTKDE